MPVLTLAFRLLSILIPAAGLVSNVSADEPKPAGPTSAEKVKIPAVAPSEYFILTGEELPSPFVPLKPRTVEDRKQVEATTAYGVARALEGRREWTQAISLLENALKIDADSVTILRRLSKLSFNLGRTDAGVKFSKRVLAVEPGDTDTMSLLVNYYNRRNDPAGAEAVLREILANPGPPRPVLSPDQIPGALDSDKFFDRFDAVMSLRRSGPAAFPQIEQLLNAPSRRQKLGALQVLAFMRPTDRTLMPDAVRAHAEALSHDPDETIRTMAMRALRAE